MRRVVHPLFLPSFVSFRSWATHLLFLFWHTPPNDLRFAFLYSKYLYPLACFLIPFLRFVLFRTPLSLFPSTFEFLIALLLTLLYISFVFLHNSIIFAASLLSRERKGSTEEIERTKRGGRVSPRLARSLSGAFEPQSAGCDVLLKTRRIYTTKVLGKRLLNALRETRRRGAQDRKRRADLSTRLFRSIAAHWRGKIERGSDTSVLPLATGIIFNVPCGMKEGGKEERSRPQFRRPATLYAKIPTKMGTSELRASAL